MTSKYKHAVLLAVGEHHSGTAKEGERIVEAVFEALSAALAEDGKKVLGRNATMTQVEKSLPVIVNYMNENADEEHALGPAWEAMHDAATCELTGGVDHGD